MFKDKQKIIIVIAVVFFSVFIVSLILLIVGSAFSDTFDLLGIRLATLFVSFASFCSTSLFSFLIFNHNYTVKKTNDDANLRAELFREFQFSSNNYSIVDFINNMTIYKESERYINRFVCKNDLKFHMLESGLMDKNVCAEPNNYYYLSLRFPYHVVEGKMVANINFRKLVFERDDREYLFLPPDNSVSSAFLLYNEADKSNEAIINLILDKNSDFFRIGHVNVFSKIKISINTISLLGVEVKGTVELYFTNPEKKEKDGTNVYKINSSNFVIKELPKIKDNSHYKCTYSG